MSLLLLLCLLGLVSGLPRIHVDDGFFTDEFGRVRLFHGINSVTKHFPWYDPAFLEPVRHQQMKDWGLSAIRLGAMWTGLEPEEGSINETYVGVLKDIVKGLGDQGVYTYLDMHQDMLIDKAAYWGIPPWLDAKMETGSQPYPWPINSTKTFTTWECGYFTKEITSKSQQLYTNHRQEFANIWKAIAQRFKGDPNILGYELINEPWTGDFFDSLPLLLPANSGYEYIQPFSEAASEAIRQEDDETIVMWEPVTWAYFLQKQPLLEPALDMYVGNHNYTALLNFLEWLCGPMAEDAHETLTSQGPTQNARPDGMSSLGPGFTAPPGGHDYLNRTAMSWHYYCWALDDGHPDQEYDPVLRYVCDEALGPMIFNTVDARAEELGGSATFLTEFGNCVPSYDQPDKEGNIECNFIMGEADKHFQSWSYWNAVDSKILWDKDGNPDLNGVRVFARPHPQATAGKPISLQYDPYTRVMEYSFLPNQSLVAFTEVFVPSVIYTEGYSVTVSENLIWYLDQTNTNIILVRAENEEPAHIAIRPKD